MKPRRSSDPVLVVEDDADGREMLVHDLPFRGFAVHGASSGAEAGRAGCDAFISKPFDLATLADYVDRCFAKGARSWKSSRFEA